jgi:hypothetical protein
LEFKLQLVLRGAGSSRINAVEKSFNHGWTQMNTNLRNIGKPGDRVVFSLSSPTGGAGVKPREGHAPLRGWGEGEFFAIIPCLMLSVSIRGLIE